MTGTYRMVAENGEVFEAAIPVFSLDLALRGARSALTPSQRLARTAIHPLGLRRHGA